MPDPRLKGRVIIIAVSEDDLWVALSPELCATRDNCDDLMAAVYWDSDAHSPQEAVKAVVSRQIERLGSGVFALLAVWVLACVFGAAGVLTIITIDATGVANRKNLARMMAQYRELENQSLTRFREVEKILEADMHTLDLLTHYNRYVRSFAAWEATMGSYLPMNFLESCTISATTTLTRFQSALDGLATLSAEREGIAGMITRTEAGRQRWKSHVEVIREGIRHYRKIWISADSASGGSVLTAEDIPVESFEQRLRAIDHDYREVRTDIVETFARVVALRRMVTSSAWSIALRHYAHEIPQVPHRSTSLMLQREEEYFLSVARISDDRDDEQRKGEDTPFLWPVGALWCVYEQRLKRLKER